MYISNIDKSRYLTVTEVQVMEALVGCNVPHDVLLEISTIINDRQLEITELYKDYRVPVKSTT